LNILSYGNVALHNVSSKLSVIAMLHHLSNKKVFSLIFIVYIQTNLNWTE